MAAGDQCILIVPVTVVPAPHKDTLSQAWLTFCTARALPWCCKQGEPSQEFWLVCDKPYMLEDKLVRTLRLALRRPLPRLHNDDDGGQAAAGGQAVDLPDWPKVLIIPVTLLPAPEKETLSEAWAHFCKPKTLEWRRTQEDTSEEFCLVCDRLCILKDKLVRTSSLALRPVEQQP